MNRKLKRTLAIAGLMSVMTLSSVHAADQRLIMSGNVENQVGLSGVETADSGNGGAILNSGYDLTIVSGTFANNVLTSVNQAVFGGAIYQELGKLDIRDGVIFQDNKVQSASQTYPGWSGVDSASGGAIYMTAAQATIGNVSFLNNKALHNTEGGESNGGAIFMQGSDVTMGNVVFTDNLTNTRGGAIYNGDSVLIVTRGEFTNNQAKTGGAIYMYDVTGTTVTNTGTGSKFERNTASGNGGAVANFDSTLNVGEDNVFSSNETSGNGGAIYNASFNGTSVTTVAGGTQFTGNHAFKGGAIYNSGKVDLTSGANKDITFSGNTATNGGASVYLDGNTSQLNINGEAGTVAFKDNGAIAGFGTINKSGVGTVEFVGNTEVAAFIGKYIQNNGILKLTDSTMFNNYNINLGEFNLTGSSTAIANGANKAIKDVAGVTVSISNGASLDVTGGTLGMNNKIALGGGGELNVSNSADIYFKGDSTWEGDVNNSGGNVILDGYTHSTAEGGGNYTQTGGDLTLQNGSDLTLGNAESSISGGTVDIQSGNTLSIGGGGTLSGGQTSVSGELNVNGDGIISKDAGIELKEGANLNISDGGKVTLDNEDTWEGTITNNNSTLTLDGVSHKTENGAYDQDGGILNLVNNSNLTLDNNGTINDGNVNVSDSTLVVDNGGLIEGGTVTVGNGSTFEIKEGGSVTGGKVDFIGDNITANVNGEVLAEAIFNVTNGNTVVINSPGNVTINSNDYWNDGTIHLQGGKLNFTGTASGTNDKFLGDGGNLNITGNSNFVVGADSYIKGDVVTNIETGSSLDLIGGNVVLDTDDTWNGTVNLNNGNLNYSADQNGALHASGGNLATSAGSVLDIESGSYIEETVNANIQGELNISGVSAGNTGYVTLGSGDTLLGNTNINDYGVLNLGDNVRMADSGQSINFNGADAVMNLETNNKLDLKAELVGTDGQINKNGSGDVKFSGGTSNYQGDLVVNNSGNLTFVDEDGFGGNLKFGNVWGEEIGIIADKIHGEINQTVDAEITYSTYRDIDLNFNEKVNVLQGELIAKTYNGKDVNFNSEVTVKDDSSLIVYSGRNVNFNETVELLGGTAEEDYSILALMGNSVNAKEILAENSIIYTDAKNTVFNNLSLTDSTLQLVQNGFTTQNLALSGNSNIYMMNGVVTDNNVGNLFVDDAAVGNFSIDISPRDWTSDKIIAGAVTTNGIGTLNVSDFQFINKCPIDRHVPLQIFDTSRPGFENMLFTATDKEIRTPIGYYGLFPSATGNGMYNASLTRYVPEVFRGQVATMSTWQNQLTINNILFDHVQEVNMQYLSQSQPNKYAALYPQFAPYQYDKKDGSLWFKPFGTIEKLNMTQGLNVNNTFYGALIGADFPAVELKRGWTMLPTAYVGYTGAHQSYNGVGMYQNGGQAGAMATFMKNDFIGSIMAFGGGYSNRMDVGNATDNTGNWIAGTAAKAAYNFHPSKHFVIQPTLMASYTYLGQQNWHSNYGDMSMRAEMLNGVNVAPGINFIYGRETWSIYATVQYFYNVLGYTGGLAGNDVDLPHLRMRHGFIQYGIGATKTWKDRFSGFLQIVIRNGGRTGVGFMGGITFKF